MAYKSDPRGTRPVSLIVIHTAEGAKTAENLGAYFFRPDIMASSHVGIDDSKILQYVPYNRAAWTVRSGNPISVNAELCGFAAWSRDTWLNQHHNMLVLTAKWITDMANMFGIPKVKLTPLQVGQNKWGVIGHIDWTLGMHDGTHTDPGPGFPWDYVMQLVNNKPVEDDMTRDEFLKTLITPRYSDGSTGNPVNVQTLLEWTDNRALETYKRLDGVDSMLTDVTSTLAKLQLQLNDIQSRLPKPI